MPELKPQNYRDDRPAEIFTRFHEHSRTHEPDWIWDLVRMVTTPISLFAYRTKQLEVDHVPASGPVILAANHFSAFDHFLAGVWLRRKIRFLAKSQIFGRSRVLDYIFLHGGVFPIRRGHADQEGFDTIHAVLRRGGCLMVYCEGGRSRSGELGKPRPGVGRAALETGVPVVPVAIHGSQGVRRWRRLIFPKVAIHYGEPISFAVVDSPTRKQQAECAAEIFADVRAMYEELEQYGGRAVARRLRAERSGSGEGSPSYS